MHQKDCLPCCISTSGLFDTLFIKAIPCTVISFIAIELPFPCGFPVKRKKQCVGEFIVKMAFNHFTISSLNLPLLALFTKNRELRLVVNELEVT